MLTPYLPFPPASGGQIRSLNLLKHLSKHHEITLICLYKNDREKQYASTLQSYCHEIYLCKRPEKPWQPATILTAVFSFLPFLIARNYSSEAHDIIKKLLREHTYDVIHAETFYIMPHIAQTNIPVFLVEQTIEYKVYQHFVNSLPFVLKTFFYIDIFKLKHWERYYWKKASTVGAVSEADARLIRTLEPTIKPVIVPNGAGDDMFVPALLPKRKTKQTLLFMGNFSWLQNTEAAEYLVKQIFPLVVKRMPAVECIIAGQNAQKKITSLQDQAAHIKIVDIPQDDIETVKKLYIESSLFIAPVFGPGGTNLKILAAMASGLPVVSTSIGAERLEMKNKKNVWMADAPETFADGIVKLLQDDNLYENIRKNAYTFAKEKYSWSAISKNLEIAYKNIITHHENRN